MEGVTLEDRPLPDLPTLAGPELAALLASERGVLNALYFQAQGDFPGLDEKVFGPWFLALAESWIACPGFRKLDAEAKRVGLGEVFEAALGLTGREILGRSGKFPGLDALVLDLVHWFPNAWSAQPRTFLFSVVNLILGFYRSRPAFLGILAGKFASLSSLDLPWSELRKTILIAAWQASLAEYRPAALAAARELRDPVVFKLLDPESAWEGHKNALVERLEADRWFVCLPPGRQPVDDLRTLGGFRGYGGEFLVPPLVGHAHGRLMVSCSGTLFSVWLDAYGGSLVPDPESRVQNFHPALPTDLARRLGALGPRLEQRGLPTASLLSATGCDGGLVLTSRFFHRVFLVPPSWLEEAGVVW